MVGPVRRASGHSAAWIRADSAMTGIIVLDIENMMI
jgi:hypothetical protein